LEDEMTAATTDREKPDPPRWTFLTNHSHVLICLARDPGLRLRDIAEAVGITERAVQAIIADLEQAAVITRQRNGRRNRYTIDRGRPLRHRIEASHKVGDLLALVGPCETMGRVAL
jgi:DNA-binding MarR family transcriptional regulator